jgi:hypothetical protein
MKCFRARDGRRALVLAVVIGVVTAVLGLGGTPASALNHDSYNILRNAGLHNYCLDIRTEDKAVGARAHLWTCTKDPRPPEQQFLLLTNSFGQDNIEVQRSGYCLSGSVTIFGGATPVTQVPCGLSTLNQTWQLRDSGEIVNTGTGDCLDAAPSDTKDADVVVVPCNGSISQRWFF